MRCCRRVLGVLAVVMLGGVLWGSLAAAGDDRDDGSKGKKGGALFVMTNDAVLGNRIAMYKRAANGDLSGPTFFPTGGLGSGPAPTAQIFRLASGGALPLVSAQFDGLGSSNSLILSKDNRCLFAVNAGSNTVSSFRVRDNGLDRMSVVDSEGRFPVSLTAYHDVLYVLNTGEGNPDLEDILQPLVPASLAGFRVHDCALESLGKARDLSDLQEQLPEELGGPDPSFPIPAPNEVLTTPAQVSFTPDGRRLVLSIKGLAGADVTGGQLQSLPNGRMAVFPVRPNGQLGTPMVTPFSFADGTGGPFSFIFINPVKLVVVHANSGTVASFTLNPDHSLSLTKDAEPISTGAFAPCWLDGNERFVYTASFGAPSGVLEIIGFPGQPDASGALTGFRVKQGGTLEPLGEKGNYNYRDPGYFPGLSGTGNHAIDVRVIDKFLYFIQPRVGMIGRLTIGHDGSLMDEEHFGGLAVGLEPYPAPNFFDRCFLQNPVVSPECYTGSAQGIAGF